MPLYIAIDARTGAQRRLSSRDAKDVEPLAADEALVQLDQFTVEPVGTHRWDAAHLTYVPVPGAAPLSTSRETVLDFLDRFSDAEGIAIERMTVEHPDGDVRAALRRLDKDLRSTSDGYIDRADPRMRKGLTLLASLGLIAPARVDEILSGA